MTYRQAIDFLEGRERFGIRLGLANMSRLLAALGEPQRGLKVFHVAGTNGKGSTARLTAGLLQASGFRVGLYTSPHLLDTRERVQVDQRPVSRADFTRRIEELAPVVERLSRFRPHSPTYFEVLTALAFSHFALEKVDFAVIEVGLGGRMDATNLVQPLVSIITPIGLEHKRYLGNSLAAIAGEKGGIIKPGRPVVISTQRLSAGRVLRRLAGERRSTLYQVGRDIRFEMGEAAADSNRFNLAWPGSDRRLENLELALPGRYQVENAALALLALEAAGLRPGVRTVRRAFRKVRWPGRLQVIRKEPPVLFDVSHNPPAIRVLVQNLEALYPGCRYRFIFGVLRDKDYRQMLKTLAPKAAGFILTRPDSNRARDPQELADWLGRRFPGSPAIVAGTPREALETGLGLIGRGELLCICGSFYLASVLKYINSASRKASKPPSSTASTLPVS